MDTVQEYLNAKNFQFRDIKELLDEFSNEISEMKGRCIDIGCGPGDVTKELILPKLPRDAMVVGADISESMINYAKQKYREAMRLSFVQLDIETLELPTKEIGQYDNVMSSYCLHWCQNTRRAFENIYQLLRPGGKALVMFIAYNAGFDAYVRVHDNPRYQPYMQDAHKYVPFFQRCDDSRASLRKLLEDIGFEIIHCSKREKFFIYENMQILKSHALAINPFISRIPEHLKEEFETTLLHEITRTKILFPKRINDREEDYSILDSYHILIAYFRKPLL